MQRLRRWSARTDLGETSAEAAFIEEFFRATWGYVQSGQAGSEREFTLWPQFTIPGAGAAGGSGKADLGIGYFPGNPTPIPQVLCEFKDIRSALDADQRRKGSTRSPVRQCLDYLGHARRGMIGSEPMVPTWGLVTDMNEFRLYWYDRGDQQCLRFVIRPRDLFQGTGLLADADAARFDRYLFARLLHRDTLLSRGGSAVLLDLIAQRRFQDRQIEFAFYRQNRAFRDHLLHGAAGEQRRGHAALSGNPRPPRPASTEDSHRLLFVFFCEDMGQALAFPPKLLQGFLTTRSADPYFDPDATTIWYELLRLFQAMNTGTAFAGKAIHQFNGGLFAPDPALEALHVPNRLFCQPMQGQNDASIRDRPLTLLYFCATYNYVADLSESGLHGERKRLGLYMLGRIFEQSITELEILEAEADGRPSVNKASKRKRDGVYYTPEWVVERVVAGTLGPCLADIRRNCGWPPEGEDLPELAAVGAYLGRLGTFTVLDPACGSGAFLITALRYLLAEWEACPTDAARGDWRPSTCGGRGGDRPRYPALQPLRRGYQPRLSRDRPARALAAHRARRSAAVFTR